MIRRLALAGLVALFPAVASAQFAIIGPTQPTADNGDRLATTAWVNNFFAGGIPLANGKVFIGSVGGVAVGQTPSGDWTISNTGVATLATVNGNVGTFGSATQCITTTQNAKGLTTAISAATCTPAISSITGLGTGVATALGVATNGAGGIPVPAAAGTNGQVFVGVTAAPPAWATMSGDCTITNAGVVTCGTQGTFTPTVSFGGASVGITYGTQAGKYTKIGNVVNYAILIVLTSKGSSVGAASIDGLPFTSSTFNGVTAAVQTNNMAAGTTTALQGQVAASVTSATLSKYAAGVNTQLADTDFTNTSVVRIAGIYFTP